MLVATASYAQKVQAVHQTPNTSTVNQNGNSQRAQVTQSGSAYRSNIQQTSTSSVVNQGNYAETLQRKGQSSEAFINQIGSKSGYVKVIQENGEFGANTAIVNQKNNSDGDGTRSAADATADEATKTGGNYSWVYQNGSKQKATINQNDNSKGNQASVDQANNSTGQIVVMDQNNNSSTNKATAGQAGGGNNTSISQSNYSSGNSAEVVQGISTFYGGPRSYNATAVVEQNGLDFKSSIGNTATIRQMDIPRTSSAMATIRQNASTDASGNYSISNQGTIIQTKGGNTGTIDQNNSSINNTATISQDATKGTATVSQSNDAKSNIATLNQISGSGLKVDVKQDNRTVFNQTTTNQYGTNSEISVEQVASSSDNNVFINQGAASTTSSDNKARVYQKEGSQKGEVTINQNQTKDGSGDYAQVQQAYLDGTSMSNKATIGQEGSRNTTRLSQGGTGNHVTMITQTGNNNIVQGPGTSLYETGPMAVQKGDGNKMTVSQTSPDGANTSMFNTANLSQEGMTNTLSLTQTANSVSNVSTISQAGTGNLATVTQMGNGVVVY